MKFQRILALCLFGAGFFGAGLAQATPCKRVVAYYPEWSKYASPPYAYSNIPWSKLTHVCHSFITPNTNGSLNVPSGFIEAGMITAAHAAGVKVLVSIGGGGGSGNFATAANNTNRAALVDAIYNFINVNGYDGVDVDWEFPTTNAQRSYFTNLIVQLRAKFNGSPSPAPGWLITSAINPSSYGAGFIDLTTCAASMDFFNAMTYDYHGNWGDHVGHNAQILGASGDPDGASVNTKVGIDYMMVTRGIAASQLNLGLAFYGYRTDSAENIHDTCPSSDCSSATIGVNYIDVAPLVGAGWTRTWDATASSPYLRKDVGAGFISYDDTQSIQIKADYGVNTRGLGGVFMWSLDGDASGGNQPLLDALITGLACFTTPTNSPTVTPTRTPSFSQSPTRTATQTRTPSATQSFTRSHTGTPSQTLTRTAVLTSSATPVQSFTGTPSQTLTRTGTLTPSVTPVQSVTGTPSPGASATPSRTPSMTRSPTWSPSAGNTSTATPSDTKTASATPTASPTKTASPTQTANGGASATDTRTFTETRTASPTKTASLTPTASPTRTVNSGTSATDTRTFTETRTATTTRTLTSTRTLTPYVTAGPSFTHSPVVQQSGGMLKIDAQAPVPNPNPIALSILLEGDVESAELAIYDTAMLCVGKARTGPLAMGWGKIFMPNDWIRSAPNGVYYYRVSVFKEGNSSHGLLGKLLILR